MVADDESMTEEWKEGDGGEDRRGRGRSGRNAIESTREMVGVEEEVDEGG